MGIEYYEVILPSVVLNSQAEFPLSVSYIQILVPQPTANRLECSSKQIYVNMDMCSYKLILTVHLVRMQCLHKSLGHHVLMSEGGQ